MESGQEMKCIFQFLLVLHLHISTAHQWLKRFQAVVSEMKDFGDAATEVYSTIYRQKLLDLNLLDTNSSEYDGVPLELLQRSGKAFQLSKEIYEANYTEEIDLSKGSDGRIDCVALLNKNDPQILWVVSRCFKEDFCFIRC